MTDLVERGKMQAALFKAGIEPEPTLRAFIDEIERLRAALETIANRDINHPDSTGEWFVGVALAALDGGRDDD